MFDSKCTSNLKHNNFYPQLNLLLLLSSNSCHKRFMYDSVCFKVVWGLQWVCAERKWRWRYQPPPRALKLVSRQKNCVFKFSLFLCLVRPIPPEIFSNGLSMWCICVFWNLYHTDPGVSAFCYLKTCDPEDQMCHVRFRPSKINLDLSAT